VKATLIDLAAECGVVEKSGACSASRASASDRDGTNARLYSREHADIAKKHRVQTELAYHGSSAKGAAGGCPPGRPFAERAGWHGGPWRPQPKAQVPDSGASPRLSGHSGLRRADGFRRAEGRVGRERERDSWAGRKGGKPVASRHPWRTRADNCYARDPKPVPLEHSGSIVGA